MLGVEITSRLLIPVGALLFVIYSPLVVLSHEYLSKSVGFSSGITLGASIGIGGAATSLLGLIADYYGIWSSMACLVVMSPILVILSLLLPHPGNMRNKDMAT